MATTVYYPQNLNAYAQGDIATWAKNNGLDYVAEIHFNAFNGSATGTENWTYSGFSADAIDIEIPKALASAFGLSLRGTKGTDQLANVLRMANIGISYCLIETHFGDNSSDHPKMADRAKIGAVIKSVLDKYYPNGKVGIVYGHGGGDPGAIAFNGEYESNFVRSIKVENGAIEQPKEDNEMPVFKEEINAQRNLVEFTKGRGVYAGAGADQFKYYDIPAGTKRIIFPLPTKNGPYLWSLAINPDNINDTGFIAIYENDNPTFKVLKKGYNFEVAPPKPPEPLKLIKLNAPEKRVLKNDLYQCRVEVDKVVIDTKIPMYKKGDILTCNYYVDYNKTRYLFKDEKGLIGTSIANLPIDETKINLILLGKEI